MVAGEHDSQPTCLSEIRHTENIQNHVLHYLGCIERCERDKFFEPDNELYEHEYKHLLQKLEEERNENSQAKTKKGNGKEKVHDEEAEARDETKLKEYAKLIVTNKLEQWQEACDTEIRRIKYLRTCLSKDKETQQLVQNIDETVTKWRASEQYKKYLPKVQEWRSSSRRSNSTANVVDRIASESHAEASNSDQPRNTSAEGLRDPGRPRGQTIRSREDREDYQPEKDYNLHIIEYEEKDAWDGEIDDPHQAARKKHYFSDNKKKIDRVFAEVANLKDPEANPLYKGGVPGRLRYIHLPANNMVWVEEAIARYYGENRPKYDGIYRELQENEKTQSYMILRPHFWRGQLHGGRSAPPHARHMRALCDTVSSDPKSVEQSPKNMVLFMPYLHWETDRQREKFALEIENITEKWKRKKKEDEQKRKKTRIGNREGLPKVEFKPWPAEGCEAAAKKSNWFRIFPRNNNNADNVPTSNGQIVPPGRIPHGKHEPSQKWCLPRFREPTPPVLQRPTLEHHDTRVPSMPTLIKRMGYGKEKDGLPVKNGRVISDSPLGQFLIDAARLYEEMANYRDKKLLQEYLHKELPLHPRRTLDQSYYWTLNTTKNRDRDQVVYRGTKSGSFHQYDPKSGRWPEHDEQKITPEDGCDACRANIRKVSRVIMVDQLWMWILDEQTIITCFPKRYGANKQETDASSVHKSIRTRLQNSRQNHIRSVFDLALVIIDECSSTLFDRVKTRDRQPQVMDAFSEAIGNVTNKQTAAFDRLYRWTKAAAKVYRTKSKIDPEAISDLHVPLLDIYPEGILQREIKDIVEELEIMLDINRTQKKVLKDFILHVEHILDPHRRFAFHGRHVRKTSMMNGADSSVSQDERGSDFQPGHLRHPHHHQRSSSFSDHHGSDEHTDNKDDIDDKREIYEWFKVNAEELVAKVSKRIEDLEVLERTAQSTSSSLTDLLALKQQQASVVQAWQSVKQSEEAVSQGRSIMMFTVVTIFFLPLSFMASVFGMNAFEFGQGTVKLAHEFKYMFPISFFMIIPIFVLAFSTWIRALIWFTYKYAVTITVVKTGIYGLWLKWGWTSRTLLDHAAKETEKLKNEVRERKCRLRREERKKQDEEWENGLDPPLTTNPTFPLSRHNSKAPENHEMTQFSRNTSFETV